MWANNSQQLKNLTITETKRSSRTDSDSETTFGMKRDTIIGFWNVRTLYQAGKLRQLVAVAEKYKLDILGVSEVRWNKFGEMVASGGRTFLYSGKPNEDDPHTEGVGLLLSKKGKNSLLDWKPVSSRIMCARFRGRVRNISIIQCYAPTEDAEEEVKASFYAELQATVQTISKKDILIAMGDFNAKVGSDNLGLEQVMGEHGLGTINNNGELLVDFCASNSLVIGGTVFPHKKGHKVSWISPDLRTQNQIDHFAISRKWRQSLLDVRNRRGADIGSDHHLMTAKVRIKIAAVRKRFQAQDRRFDVGKLKSKDSRQEFILKLKNRFEGLCTEEADIEEHWAKVKTALKSTAEEVLGYKNSNRKEWMSQTTWDCIEQRREVKLKLNNSKTRLQKTQLQAAYQARDREVKRSARADRARWVSDLAAKAEAMAGAGNMKELYNITRTLSRKRAVHGRPVRDKKGELLASKEAQLARWREHFMELLNGGSGSEPEPEPERDSEEDGEERGGNVISSESPSRGEIKAAIKQLKNGKAPGVDNIAPELLTADADTTTDLLHPLFTKIWRSESMPQEWKEGILVKLPKKGDATKCNNWRGITLLSIPSKVLTRVILNRIQSQVEMQLRKEQAGFRSNRSCTDQINALRIMIEQSNEFVSHLHLLFVDFEKAFDSLKRKSMWKALRKYGIPEKVSKIIKETYNNYKCRVIHEGGVTEPFAVSSGVRQGCVLSPTIFLLVLDEVMGNIMRGKKRGIQWGMTERLEDLDFADDICLLSQRHADMEEKLRDLEREAGNVGLKVNVSKTKVMKVNTRDQRKLMVRGVEIEEVAKFTYLGSVVTQDGGAAADVRARIRKANAAFIQLYPVWRAREISTATKLRIFRSNVKAVLLYGCETWKVTTEISRNLQVFINRCLRKMLQIFWPNIISNEDLWKQTKEEPVATQIKRRKWRWIGHTLRKNQDAIERQVLSWNPQGKRKRGRPRTSWRRTVEEEARGMEKTFGELRVLARNRVRWHSFVEALCSG